MKTKFEVSINLRTAAKIARGVAIGLAIVMVLSWLPY